GGVVGGDLGGGGGEGDATGEGQRAVGGGLVHRVGAALAEEDRAGAGERLGALEVELTGGRAGGVAQLDGGTVERQAAGDGGVGAVDRGQVEVVVEADPGQGAAGGGEDQLGAAGLAHRAPADRPAQRVPRAGGGGQGQRRAGVVQGAGEVDGRPGAGE